MGHLERYEGSEDADQKGDKKVQAGKEEMSDQKVGGLGNV